MLNFYFVRHGLKELVPFDPPLTEAGLKQAKVTAKFLRNVDFKEVVVSPKLRARQTAKAIIDELKLPISLDDRLQERLEWEHDQNFNEFMSEWIKTDIDRKYKPKNNGNSSCGKGEEMKKVVEELSNKHQDGNILIVSHGGAIGDFLRGIFGKENIPHVKHPRYGVEYVRIDECSITIISKDKEKYELIKLNGKNHLE